MARQSEQSTDEQRAETKKYKVMIDERETYRCDIRDARGGLLETYLVYDIDFVQSLQMKREFKRLESEGAKHLKPGEIVELPKAQFTNPMNAAGMMVRAGALKEI